MAKKKSKTLTAEQVIKEIENLTATFREQVSTRGTTTQNSPTNASDTHKVRLPCVYIDGAKQHSGGGWGVVAYLEDGSAVERGDYVQETTNNRMEMQAAIEACKLITELELHLPGTKVTVYSDSQYVIKGITQWIHTWKANGWNSTSGPVKNRDLWEELDLLNHPIIKWEWVKGHSGVVGNERADTIAEGFASKKPVTLVSKV